MNAHCRQLGRHHCHHVAAVMLLLLLLLAVQSKAQNDGGPVIIDSREQLNPFAIYNMNSSLELLYRTRRDSVNPKSGVKTTDTEDLFRESLRMSANAYIMHPNFIDMSLSGAFYVEQRHEVSETFMLDERTLEFPNEFDVRGTYLRRSNAPLTVFAQRNQTLIDRQFAGTLDSVSTSYGVTLPVRFDSSTHFFNFTHREQEQTEGSGLNDFELTQDTFEYQSVWTPTVTQQLETDYRYEKIDEGGPRRADNAYERHDGEVTHTLRFGASNEHDLRSSVYYITQMGDFAFDSLRVDETLRLQHSDTLETRYDYFFNEENRQGTDQTLHRGRGLFRHRLYDSLVTTGSFGGSFLDVSDGFTSDEFFGDLLFNYTKKVPFGRFSADVSLGLNRQDNSERGQPITITGDVQTFTDPAPVTLSQRNILDNTIVVNRVPGPGIFTKGVDYTVRTFADRVEVRRVIGGAIASGDAVTFDYVVGPEPANIITTSTVGLSGRYTIEEGPLAGLDLYARYLDLSQDIDSDRPSLLIANSISDMIYGAEYRIWQSWLRAEYQMHDSTISPFNALRLEGHFIHRPSRANLLSVDITYDDIDFTDENNTTQLLTVSGTARHQFTNTLGGQIELLWRQQQDDIGGDSNGFEQRLDLDWRYRQTYIYLRARNSMFDSDTTDNMFQTFEIGIRRNF